MTVQLNLDDLRSLLADVKSAPRDVMTAQQVADYFGVSKSSVMRYTRDENDPLPCGYFGSDPRFFRADVVEWMRRRADRLRQHEDTK